MRTDTDPRSITITISPVSDGASQTRRQMRGGHADYAARAASDSRTPPNSAPAPDTIVLLDCPLRVTRMASSDPTPLLLPLVARGERDAVARVVERYGDLVWSLARRFTGSDADAEEATQDIFAELWKKAASFDPALGAEVTFVSIITRRSLIDRQRRGAARQRHEQRAADLAASLGHGVIDPKALAGVQRDADVARAAEALAELGELTRELLLLSIAHGRSHEEIAAQKGMPLGTVKTHIRRGLASIRESLGVVVNHARAKP